MNKNLIEKIKEITRYYGYDLEVAPNLLKCAAAILLEVAKEIKGEISND